MFRLSVSYPANRQATFDLDYYKTKHMPMVRICFGRLLLKDELWVGTASLEGETAAHQVVLHMYFDDRPAFDERFSEIGGQIAADIPNYTDIAPIVQFEVLSN